MGPETPAESEISAFSSPEITPIPLQNFYKVARIPNSYQRSSSAIIYPNCRSMRGLRGLLPQPIFRAPSISRLYSTSSSPSFATQFINMGKQNNTAVSSSGSEESLPKLSPSEFRTYNRMAEHMDAFHNHFRVTWNQLWDACNSTGKKPAGLSARQMIMSGLQFCSQLDFHHSIEEQHIFPVLAKKMPEFKKELELLKQHKQIHAGLEKLEAYLEKCRSGEEDMRREEVKRLMEGFGEVLWKHLDEEVKTLGAENMRKYWSPEEMRRLPM